MPASACSVTKPKPVGRQKSASPCAALPTVPKEPSLALDEFALLLVSTPDFASSTPAALLVGRQLSSARRRELRGLAVRKYLDALCVYFWAATSLLFSALTFGLVVLLGGPQALTPAGNINT